MKHGRSCNTEIWWPSAENVALRLRCRATFSTSGLSYVDVTLTTVPHLYNVQGLDIVNICHFNGSDSRQSRLVSARAASTDFVNSGSCWNLTCWSRLCHALPYLSEHCIPVSSADTWQHLHSTNHHLLAIMRFRLNTYGSQAFSVAGPMASNSLPDFNQDPTSSTNSLRHLLKMHLYLWY